MFDHTDSSMFDYQDEIGIDSCREDFNAVFNSNLVTVKLIHNDNDDGDIPYDYSGVIKYDNQTNFVTFLDTEEDTYITDVNLTQSFDSGVGSFTVINNISNYSSFFIEDTTFTSNNKAITKGKRYNISFEITSLTSTTVEAILGYNTHTDYYKSLGVITAIGSYRYDNVLFDTDYTSIPLLFRLPPYRLQNSQVKIKNLRVEEVPSNRDSEELIQINIMSNNPDYEEMQEQGFERKGEVRYNCYASWDVNIKNSDTIEFISDYGYNIQQGSRFRIEFKDSGLYQGQYTFKNFDLIQK